MGIMNMAALQVSLTQGIREAIGFALAAGAFEGLMIYGTGYLGASLLSQPKLLRSINVISATLLFFIGCLFCYKVWATSQINQISQLPDLPGWQYGIWLRLLNPIAVLFWLGVHLALADGKGEPPNRSRLVIFAVGGIIGTLSAYAIYILLAHQLDSYLKPWSSKINLVLGIFCFAAATYKWREKSAISELP